MSTVAALINQAFEDLGVVRPGESVSAALQASALLVLQQRWQTYSLMREFNNVVYHQSFTLSAGTATYLVKASGGDLTSTVDPIRITAWRSVSGNFEKSGVCVSFEELAATSRNDTGKTSQLAEMVAADNLGAGVNIRVYPTPASSPGSLILDYMGALVAITGTSQTLTLAPGYEDFIHNDLAAALYPRYKRVTNTTEDALAANRQNALEIITSRNAAILGLQRVPAGDAPAA